jgi:hypothetical protein
MSDPRDTQPGSARPQPDPAPGRPPDTQPNPLPAAPPPAVQVGGNVGGDVVGGDLHRTNTAGRDIVGRDVVTTTTTTHVGFSAAAVQRLLITVGAMIFVTAACFFSGGVFVGGAALAALNTNVNSNNPVAAAEFAQILQALESLPPGTPFQFTFTEEQISAYFRQVLAPRIGVSDGKVRLLADGRLVVGGQADDLGGLPFAATYTWQDTPGEPLRLVSAAVQVLRVGPTSFGWVAVPTGLLGSTAGRVNELFGSVQLVDVDPVPGREAWTVEGVGW